MSVKGKIHNEVIRNFDSKFVRSQSKHEAKKAAEADMKIFSYSTLKTYKACGIRFADYCHAEYGCRNIADMRGHVGDYISQLRAEGKSAWTQKQALSALGKMYGCSFFGEVETDRRPRSTVTRSRDVCERDYHFSEKKNAELIDFCLHTGLRRHELESLTGRKVDWRDGQAYVHIDQGTKGGRERDVPILNNDARTIQRIESTPAGERVWERVHNACDVHSYRAQYAQALYQAEARDVRTLSQEEVYHCRGDMSGQWFDKSAMKTVSEALGHSRIDVIAQSYLGRAS